MYSYLKCCVPLLIFYIGCTSTLIKAQYPYTTTAKSKHALGIRGSIGAGTQLYNAFGIEDRNVSPMWNIYGSAVVSIYNRYTLPFSFTIGRYGIDGSYPTFKQLGFSPTYKWITVHLGWRNMMFSKYTLGGQTFLGVGVELKPGIFRFSAMKGRFRKPLNYDSNKKYSNKLPVYKREGYAFKVGVGSAESFFDVIFFKGKDDPESVDKLNQDSLPTPGENAVFGINSKLRINDHIRIFTEAAGSLYTRDVNASEIENNLSINAKKVFTPRLSSRINYAFKAGVSFSQSLWNIGISYEKIMPEYASMGAYYFKDDIERINISPTLILFNNKLRFSGSFGLQRNNLLGVKRETTKNIIGRGNISYQMNEVFGINASFNSFNLKQEDGNSVLNDTFRVAQINSSYSIAPYWNWVKDSTLVQSVTASANFQNLNDRNPFTREFTDMSTWFVNSTYVRSLPIKGINMNIGANYNIIMLSEYTAIRFGGTLGSGILSKDEKWGLNASTTFNLSSIDHLSDGFVLSGNTSMTYNLTKKRSLTFSASVLWNNSQKFDNYTEIIANLNISQSF